MDNTESPPIQAHGSFRRQTNDHTMGKKVLVTILALILGALTIVVFLIFGKLLNDYTDYIANRTHALEYLAILRADAKIHKERLTAAETAGLTRLRNLDEEIAKRQAAIAGQKTLIDDYAAWREKTTAAKSDCLATLTELKAAGENVAAAKAELTGLKSEISEIDRQKQIQRAEYTNAEKTLAQLNGQITTAREELIKQAEQGRSDRQALDEEIAERKATIAGLQTAVGEYATLMKRTETAKKEQQIALAEAKAAEAGAATASAALAALRTEIAGLEKQRQSLRDAQLELGNARTQISEQTAAVRENLSTQYEQGQTRLRQLDAEIVKRQEIISEQQRLIDEHGAWTERITKVKEEYRTTLVALEETVDQKAVLASLQAEIAVLERQKRNRIADEEEAGKTLERVQTQITAARRDLVEQFEQERMRIGQLDVEITKREEQLTELDGRIAAARNELRKTENMSRLEHGAMAESER